MSDKKEAPERIRKIIENLRKRTTDRGFTEAEALAAAEKLAELEDQYFVAMEEIGEHDDIEEVVYRAGRKLGNVWRVTSAVAHYADCKVWFTWQMSEGKRERVIKYMGLQSDTAFALYLTEMFQTLMRVEWQAYQIERRQVRHWEISAPHLRNSFEVGMMNRLSKRLYDLKRERNARKVSEGRTGQELVVVKDALVKAAFDAKFPKGLSSYKTSGAMLHDEAVEAGKRAADTVNIERPLGDDRRSRVKRG